MKQFNIRVYGLLLNSEGEVLVSDENRFGLQFTKFPGGGLEWGEGLIEALQREFLEEVNISVEVHALFYLTDFFQVSAFNKEDQVISVYYFVHYLNWKDIKVKSAPFDFDGEEEVHRWVNLSDLDANDFKFPIDKRVVEMLRARNESSLK